MSRRGEEERAFLEAVRESPHDDVPRLVYADWLEDHGEPARAEFIRVQCELARGPSDERRRAELESRQDELMVPNRRRWLGPLDGELHYGQCIFRRGFPEELTVRPKLLAALAEEFEARVPTGRVTLCGGFGDPALKGFLACPRLSWVVGLRYEHPRVAEAGLEMLANSVNLPRLADLSVRFAVFTTNGLRSLATSPHRGALRRLDLHHFSWEERSTPNTADALAAPGMPFRLRSLTLHGHRLGPAGAATLAGTENVAEVKELDLTLNGLGDKGGAALAHSPHLRGLSSLNLQTNDLTGRSVRELAGSPLLEGIRTLNLAVNEVGDEGAEALAGSPHLASLERLTLFAARLTGRGAEALAASPHLKNLRTLELAGNALTDGGSQALFESPYLQRLERITLGGRMTGDRGISQQQRKQWRKRLGKGADV